jgi:hypothetical protein
LELHSEHARRKFIQSECNDCKDIDHFIRAGIDTLSQAIEAGKGNTSVMNIAIEAKKRSEQ